MITSPSTQARTPGADPLHRDCGLAALLERARAARERWRPSIEHAASVTLDNHCANDCVYCPFARSNTKVHRFRLAPERLYADAAALADAGCAWLYLQMGQLPQRQLLHWLDAIKGCKARSAGLNIMLAAGEQTEGTMRLLRRAGVDAYAAALECADETLYQSLKPVGLYARRRFTVRSAMLAGLAVASGLTVGLPGETEDQLASSIAEVSELAPGIVLLNVFHPCPDSKLADAPAPAPETVARAIASLRLAMPDRLILAGCPVPLSPALDEAAALDAGANGVLVNVDGASGFPISTVNGASTA